MFESRRARRLLLALCGAGFVSLAPPGCLSRGLEGQSGSDVPVDQITPGATLFAEECSECHGPKGQGNAESGVPPIIGADALPINPAEGMKLRRAQLLSAADVFQFTHVNMPLDRPASLSQEEYWAIVAFMLHESGIDLRGAPVTAENAGSVRVHPH